RSPEVMFDIAAHADLLWELGRLCRQQAVEGMDSVLQDGELLFINVDPHDFADPQFDESSLHSADPERVVIEITERTAIKDYPRLRDRLQIFRERGFRFAVDDAGSGYRSEEHTSELQSRENLVCRLLLEKKNTRER